MSESEILTIVFGTPLPFSGVLTTSDIEGVKALYFRTDWPDEPTVTHKMALAYLVVAELISKIAMRVEHRGIFRLAAHAAGNGTIEDLGQLQKAFYRLGFVYRWLATGKGDPTECTWTSIKNDAIYEI